MDIYQQNLLALKVTSPLLAKKLEKIKQNKTFEVYANGDLKDANILDLRDNSPIYMNKPSIEIEDKLDKFQDMHKYPYLYFFGIGNGYFYKELLDRQSHKKIYIIEPEIELIYIALNLVDLSDEIINKKIELLLDIDITYANITKLFDNDQKLYFKIYDLDIYSPFYEKYHDEIVNTNTTFIEVFKHFVNATGNDCTDELNGLSQFLQNMPIMLKNPSLKNLTTKGKTTDTCIIVATGPSLAKQIPLLKEIQDHVTIISAESSLPILQKNEIKVDIATTIERHPQLSEFYKKTPKEYLKDIILSLTAVVHQDLLDAVKGLTLQLSMRPTGSYYKYFDFDDWGYIGEGMSTANMAYELASIMNFKRIVLIGQDLSYADDGSSHPKSHIFGSRFHVNYPGAGELIEAYGGKGKVKTMLYWKLFLNGYIKAIDYNNKHTNTITINSTEGGARIDGTVEMSFRDVIEKYIDKNSKKDKITLDYPTEDEYHKNLEKAIEKLENIQILGQSMKKRLEKILKTNAKSINKYEHIDKSNIKQHEKMINKILSDIVKIRNKYYNKKFGFYNHLLSPLIMHVEYDLAKIYTMSEHTKEDKLIKNWKMILINHELFFRILINLEAVLKIIEEKKSSIEKNIYKKSMVA